MHAIGHDENTSRFLIAKYYKLNKIENIFSKFVMTKIYNEISTSAFVFCLKPCEYFS